MNLSPMKSTDITYSCNILKMKIGKLMKSLNLSTNFSLTFASKMIFTGNSKVLKRLPNNLFLKTLPKQIRIYWNNLKLPLKKYGNLYLNILLTNRLSAKTIGSSLLLAREGRLAMENLEVNLWLPDIYKGEIDFTAEVANLKENKSSIEN